MRTVRLPSSSKHEGGDNLGQVAATKVIDDELARLNPAVKKER